MKEEPLFNTPEQAITVTFHALLRLVQLASLLGLVCLHLLMVHVVAALMWWFQVTPQQVLDLSTRVAGSSVLAAFGLLGVSAATVLSLYLLLVRWAWSKTVGARISTYLLQDTVQR